jgi:hypothetical protein
MKKIKYVFAILIISMISFVSTAQNSPSVASKYNNTEKFTDKLYFGGNLGLSFGTYTMVGIYPIVGYKITPALSSGIKITYQYINDSRSNTTYTSSNYGGSVFARYRIITQIYAHIEYETINYELFDNTYNKYRDWIPFLYVGGGFSQSIGGNTWVNAQILFDVLQDSRSPYNEWEPFYSIGVGVGF